LSKARDEKIKLLANALNTAAGSCFTVGFVGPTVAVLIDLGGAQARITVWMLATSLPPSCYISSAGSSWTNSIMTPELIFVSLILPAIVVVGAWIGVKLHERDLKRTYGR
jgi:hypothetical protein